MLGKSYAEEGQEGLTARRSSGFVFGGFGG